MSVRVACGCGMRVAVLARDLRSRRGAGRGAARGSRRAEPVGVRRRTAFVRRVQRRLMRGYFGISQPSDKSRPCDPASTSTLIINLFIFFIPSVTFIPIPRYPRLRGLARDLEGHVRL